MNIEQQLFTLDLKESPHEEARNNDSVRQNFRVLRGWLKSLSPSERREYEAAKSRVLRLTDTRSRHEIPILFNDPDPEKRQFVSGRINHMLAAMYGLKNGSLEATVTRYAQQAVDTVKEVKRQFPSDVAVSIEMVNEVERARTPARLLGIIFDPRFSIKAKFEATRQADLMHKALLVERSEAQKEIEDQVDTFTDFMNTANVWLPETKIGEFENTYLRSYHDLDDGFNCTRVDVLEISLEEAEELRRTLPKGERLTQVSRRKFKVQEGPEKDRIVSIYISNREKGTVSQILKLVRKDENNPHKAIDDNIGVRVVADNEHELELFLKHLEYCAGTASSDVMYEHISDTLGGGEYHGSSAGSSADLQMVKFFLTMIGATVEVQGFTNIGFINNLYKAGASHDEYEIRRLFEAGAMERLFPVKLYGYNPAIIMQRMIARVRRDIEDPVS